jgi:hypothetical protein
MGVKQQSAALQSLQQGLSLISRSVWQLEQIAHQMCVNGAWNILHNIAQI